MTRGREFERIGKSFVLMGGMYLAASCQVDVKPTAASSNEIFPTQSRSTEILVEPTATQELANVPIWTPPTLEQARVVGNGGGEIPDNLRGFTDTIRQGFNQNLTAISERIDFRSKGIGDNYRFVFLARNPGGNLLWAKVNSGVERYSEYPLHFNLVEFTAEDGNDYLRYVLDTQSVNYEAIPESSNADIIWGGSDDSLPVVVKDQILLLDGTKVYSNYWDITTSEWKQIPQLGSVSNIADIQNQLSTIGVNTELVDKGNGNLVLNHVEGSRSTEIGTFKQQNGETEFEVIKVNGKPYDASLEQLQFDNESGHLVILNEEGETIFAYIQQTRELKQYQDLPYLSATAGDLTIIIGDSFDRNDGYGFRNLRINNNLPRREFRDPGTGQLVELNSSDRLSLAAEVAQVVAAQAWDPNYSFNDLRNGRPYQIRTIDGKMHSVDPKRGLNFYLTAIQPPDGEYYNYSGLTNALKIWWEVSNSGEINVYSSTLPDDPLTGFGGNLDIHYRQSLITMMIYQYIGSPSDKIHNIPFASSDFQYIVPSTTDESLFGLYFSLVHEIDQQKLAALRSQVKPGQVVDYGNAVNYDIDLFNAER